MKNIEIESTHIYGRPLPGARLSDTLVEAMQFTREHFSDDTSTLVIEFNGVRFAIRRTTTLKDINEAWTTEWRRNKGTPKIGGK